jgi:hypothetical protein
VDDCGSRIADCGFGGASVLGGLFVHREGVFCAAGGTTAAGAKDAAGDGDGDFADSLTSRPSGCTAFAVQAVALRAAVRTNAVFCRSRDGAFSGGLDGMDWMDGRDFADSFLSRPSGCTASAVQAVSLRSAVHRDEGFCGEGFTAAGAGAAGFGGDLVHTVPGFCKGAGCGVGGGGGGCTGAYAGWESSAGVCVELSTGVDETVGLGMDGVNGRSG